jgi:hypothetical protein
VPDALQSISGVGRARGEGKRNGAPLRLRVGRVDAVRGGKGGFREDQGGYEWYAGIWPGLPAI